jgi:hypothetical protein
MAKYGMRRFLDIIRENESVDRSEDQHYLREFYDSCMFLAQKERGFCFGAAYFVALARNNRQKELEDFFNDNILPILANHNWPEPGRWIAAQDEVQKLFYSMKKADYDLTGLK